MPDETIHHGTWLTVAAAAAALNCHTRTIERRIASGKIQTRRTDDGQLQVLVNLPGNAPYSVSGSSPTAVDPIESVRELAQDQISLATGSASALVRLAQTDADRARGELSIARHEVMRIRKSARIAWISVATMAAGVCIAVGWTTHRITQSRDQIDSLNERSARVETEAKRLLVEATDAKTQAEVARLASAEANGKLAAYQEQARLAAIHPTTHPTNLMQKLADAMAGD